MRKYPVRVAPHPYRGADSKKRMKAANYSRIAARVERYLNGRLAAEPDDTVHVFHSYEIARDLGEDSEIVHRIVYSIDCGSGGVTIVKGDLDRAWPAIPAAAEGAKNDSR